MSWKAIPDTRPRDRESSVTECVVCAWNNTRFVGRRAQVTSRPFRDQMCVVRQVRRCMTRQRREDKTCQFEVNSTLDWKPVQLAQHWRDVLPPSSSSKKSSGGILDRLNLPDVAMRRQCGPLPNYHGHLIVVMLLTFILISIPLPHRSFIPGVKPSFSGNPSHYSLPVLLHDSLHRFRRLFTDTSEHIRLFYFLVYLFFQFLDVGSVR